MYKEIESGNIKLKLLANGATPYLYKNVFREDLFRGLNANQEKAASNDKEEMTDVGFNLIDIATKAAYVMNAQAENKRLTTLSEDDFYKWLGNFEATSLYDDELIAKIYSVLNGDMETTSEAKN